MRIAVYNRSPEARLMAILIRIISYAYYIRVSFASRTRLSKSQIEVKKICEHIQRGSGKGIIVAK